MIALALQGKADLALKQSDVKAQAAKVARMKAQVGQVALAQFQNRDLDTAAQLYIDPEECIDCDACVEACPVDACFAEDQLPDEWQNFIQINADYFKQNA